MPFCSYLLRFLTLLSLGFNLRVRGRFFVRARAFLFPEYITSRKKTQIPTTSFGGIAYDGTPPSNLLLVRRITHPINAVLTCEATLLANLTSIAVRVATTPSKWCVYLWES
jgi:hypothetical protein